MRNQKFYQKTATTYLLSLLILLLTSCTALDADLLSIEDPPETTQAIQETVLIEAEDEQKSSESLSEMSTADSASKSIEVIVQGADLDSVKAAVEDVGGIITHELRIIDSVGATLTPMQIETLIERYNLRIHENRAVETSGQTIRTMRDKFNTFSYTNNDGDVAWLGSWQEEGDDQLPNGGTISVVTIS